jgi:Zn-dependent protease
MLAIFNLVPIHPLDGGKIAVALLPHRLSLEYDDFMQKYGSIVLILLIFPFSGNSIISTIIAPIISFVVEGYAQLLIAFTGMFI